MSARQVDPRGPRFGAAVTTVVLAVVLVLLPRPVATVLLVWQAVAFGLGAFAGLQAQPYGWLFRDITASSLVKIDLEGRIVEPTDDDVNPAGFTIHSAVHAARHDAACVLHTHTVAGVAVSSLAGGLQPCNQWALQFYDRVAYHAFEGIALDLDERARLVADLGPTKRALILRNHGLVTLGRTVAEAFILMHNLDRACRVQLAIQASGQPVHPVPHEVAERTALQYESGSNKRLPGQPDPHAREWRGFLKRLEPGPSTSFRD